LKSSKNLTNVSMFYKDSITSCQGFTFNEKFQEYTLIQNKILGRTAESETVLMRFMFVLVHFLGSSYSKLILAFDDIFVEVVLFLFQALFWTFKLTPM
jgi:hypothetical protein